MKLTYHLSVSRRVPPDGFDPEDAGKMLRDLSVDSGERNLASQELLHKGDSTVKNTAPNDPLEVGKSGIDVHGEPEPRPPAHRLYADRRNPFPSHPDSRKTSVAASGDAVTGERPDHHFPQAPKVTMNILVVCAQIDDGISYHLAGAVIRNVSSAVDPADLDPPLAQFTVTRKQMIRIGISSERVDMLVLIEEQDIGNLSVQAQAAERPLPV